MLPYTVGVLRPGVNTEAAPTPTPTKISLSLQAVCAEAATDAAKARDNAITLSFISKIDFFS